MKRFLPNTVLIFSWFSLMALLPVAAIAQSLDLNANDDVIRVTYATFTGKNIIADGGGMFIDKNNESEQAWHIGAHAVLENVRLGFRTFYTSPGAVDVLVVGFGGQANLHLSPQLKLGLIGYYAPSFSSFMDSDGYTEFGLRMSFKVNRKLDVYLGYRNIKVKIEGVSRKIELDDDPHIGLKMYF